MLFHVFLTLLSPGHIVLIGGAILLLFGGKKLPGLMKGIGQGIREFKEAKDGKKEEEHSTKNH